jgi:uncharacterized protein YutE (UPF0331/DUF86 family)
MDRALIERKLELLRGHVARVRARRPPEAQQLAADADLQDIIVLNLSRAVQTCVDIGAHLLVDTEQLPPSTMGDTFTRMAATGLIDADLAQRLRRAVGFRNLAVHAYEAIDWGLVHTLAGEPLRDFDDFARAVAGALDR